MMQVVIFAAGTVRCVYGEVLDLRTLGPMRIRRASHVEPDEAGGWWVDLSPAGGPKLGPFGLRSSALQAEEGWLAEHWLSPAEAS